MKTIKLEWKVLAVWFGLLVSREVELFRRPFFSTPKIWSIQALYQLVPRSFQDSALGMDHGSWRRLLRNQGRPGPRQSVLVVRYILRLYFSRQDMSLS
ncbi:hypothetical protein C8R44DRAFT_187808 [Mycena epipterygia]|nr:hypothetical protein C8R44DRAFT_187808 [Mycena epipterygia]